MGDSIDVYIRGEEGCPRDLSTAGGEMAALEMTIAEAAPDPKPQTLGSTVEAHTTPAPWIPKEGEAVDLDEPINIRLEQEELDSQSELPALGYVATKTVSSCASSGGSELRRSVSMEAQGSCKLRAIRLNKVLQLQGCMLRKSAVDVFRHSEEVNVIDAFLSHSWKASSFAKHVALCVYYRWKPSLFAGLVAAVLGPLVCPMRLAPVVQVYIALAVVCGMTALVFTLLVWPTRQMVFLDRACIEQENPQAKTDGIMSLGYFLRFSDRVVVLWDESYFSRLWCVFELAAIMKLGESRGKSRFSNIVMLPLVHSLMLSVGSLMTISFIAVSRLAALRSGKDIISSMPTWRDRVSEDIAVALLIGLTALVFDVPLQNYAQTFRNLLVQSKNFSIGDAGCTCCSNGHVDPVTKHQISCDRGFIQSNVEAWFGSRSKFDEYAQDIGKQRLPMTFHLPYGLVLLVNLPFVLDGIGGCIWLVKSGQSATAMSFLAQRSYIDAVCSPLTMWAGCFVHHRLPLTSSSVLTRVMSALLRATLISVMGLPAFSSFKWSLFLTDAWGYFLLMPTFGGLTYLAYRN